MGGNQAAYDTTETVFDVLGTAATLAGTFGPKILQKAATKYGKAVYNKSGEVVGYKLDLFDKSGKWSARIDATTHGNPKYHHNPHSHFGQRGGTGKGVYYWWEVISGWFS